MLENNKNAVTVIYSGGDIQVPFLFYDQDDLVVLYEITPKALGTDYTVTGAGNEVGGKVTLVTQPENGTRVTVIRKVDFIQLLQIPANGIIPEGALNRALDRIVMMIQQLEEQAGRAVTYPEGTTKDDVANAGEMLDSIDKARADINNAVNVAGTTLNTANEKLGEINTVSAEKLQDMTEKQQVAKAEADRAKAEADRAQPLPIGQVIHGFWKTAPAGTLALVKAQWPIAGFPDLWNKVLAEGMAVPKATYDAIKAAKGSVGFYGIDDDGVSFWTPHYASDIYVVPADNGTAGTETGDINDPSLPAIVGEINWQPSYGLVNAGSVCSGALKPGDTVLPNRLGNGTASATRSIIFDASLSDGIYGADGDSAVKTKRVHLLYCVVAYNAVVPASVAEMVELLAGVTQIKTDNLALKGATQYVLLEERQPSNVGGGTSSVGWNDRAFNTEPVNTIEGAVFDPSDGTLRLPVGRYWCEALAMAYNAGSNKICLIAHTQNPTKLLIGFSCYDQSEAQLSGRIVLTEPTTVSISHYFGASKASNGLGVRSIIPDIHELYARLLIRKES